MGKWLALLGEDGTLTGFDKAPPSPSPEGAVEVPEGCDLVPGRYRWDGRAFQPLSGGDRGQRERVERMAAATLCRLIQELKAQGMALPGSVERWADACMRFLEEDG